MDNESSINSNITEYLQRRADSLLNRLSSSNTHKLVSILRCIAKTSKWLSIGMATVTATTIASNVLYHKAYKNEQIPPIVGQWITLFGCGAIANLIINRTAWFISLICKYIIRSRNREIINQAIPIIIEIQNRTKNEADRIALQKQISILENALKASKDDMNSARNVLTKTSESYLTYNGITAPVKVMDISNSSVMSLEVYNDSNPFPTIYIQEAAEVKTTSEFRAVLEKIIHKANGTRRLVRFLYLISSHFDTLTMITLSLSVGSFGWYEFNRPKVDKQKTLEYDNKYRFIFTTAMVLLGISIGTLLLSQLAHVIEMTVRAITTTRDEKAMIQALAAVKLALSKAKSESDKEYLNKAKRELEVALQNLKNDDPNDDNVNYHLHHPIG